MTTVALAAILAVIVAMSGFMDSFTETIDRSEQELAQGAPSRMTVDLDRFYPATSREVRGVTDSPAVGAAEPGLKLAGELRSKSGSIDASVELANPASPLWRPTVVDGAFSRGQSGVVLAEEAARDLDIGVGDTIVVRHPRRTRGGALAFTDTRMRVSALHPNTIRTFAYVGASEVDRMGFAGLANSVSVTPARGRTQDQAERALFGKRGVTTVQAVSANSDATQETLDQSTVFLRVSQMIMFGLALLMALNAAGINAEERAREHATMFAYGLRSRTVIAVAIVESVLIGILGALLGLGLGLLVVGWVTHALTPDTLPELGIVTTISGVSVAVAILAGIGAMAVAPLSLVRRLRRMDVPSTLRVVE
jgi:putative ABC transport system permease protein